MIMGNWKTCTIGDLGTVVGGATPSTKKTENYDGGTISWITPKDLAGFSGRFISRGERNITEQGLKSCSTQLLPAHTVLFSSRAPIGYIAIAEKEVCTNQGFKSVIPNDNTDYMFLYYLLKYNKDKIENLGSGTTFKEVSGSTMRGVEVFVPDKIEEQQQIASVLSVLDDKIEKNNAINENLQQQAAALFSSLYDRSNTEVRFTDLIQILGGGTPKTGENTYWNGNIAFFTPKDVGTPYTLITEKTITEEGLSHCNSRLYPVNTVFVTARGTVGKVGMSGVPMAMNQSCYALVGKETHQLLVYFYTLKVVDRLKHKASGAVFDAITTKDFESEQIMKLSDDDARAFLCIAEPMFQKVLNNCIENLRLSTLRDSLLPKLMSGEIDVSAVQL